MHKQYTDMLIDLYTACLKKKHFKGFQATR